MSVRQSLLAILDQGPCYGYQLRAEFDRRTGSTWPLNVGQIYNTLDRLERDGLVVKGEADAHGHVYYEITDAGSAEVAEWLDSPVDRGRGTRDELAVKLAVAATLPGVDVASVIRTQRVESLAQLQRLEAVDHAGGRSRGARAVARRRLDDLRGEGGAELARFRRASPGAASGARHGSRNWPPSDRAGGGRSCGSTRVPAASPTRPERSPGGRLSVRPPDALP